MRIKTGICAAVLAVCCLFSGCSSNGNGGAAASAQQGNVDFQLNSGDKIAEFNIEGYGVIKAKLFPEIAPKGVDNFIKLAESGYYSGKSIHRVIDGFMFQGGSENGDGTGGDAADGGYFGVEVSENARHFYGALCYANAMGRNTTQFYIVNADEPVDLSKYPADAIREESEMYAEYAANFDKSSQMYEYYNNMAVYYNNLSDMLEDMPESVEKKYTTEGGTVILDGGYTVFGQVYEGFDVIKRISAVEVENNGNDEISKPVQDILITSVTIGEYTE